MKMDALTIRCGGCLCNSCARPLPCTDYIYFPWSRGRTKMKSEPMNLKEVAAEDLVAMLRHVSVETGSLTCLGCGHEHNCSTRGCALIREAADRLDALRAPTREQVETMRGEWIPYFDGDHIVPERYYKCSKCGSRGYKVKKRFCPSCGAPCGREDKFCRRCGGALE